MVIRDTDISLSAPLTSSYDFCPQGHFMIKREYQVARHFIYITGQMKRKMGKTKGKEA